MEGFGSVGEVLQVSLQCVEVRTSPSFEGGKLKKYMFWKVFRWLRALGPSKGLEGRKIGDCIILCRLLKINIGTKLVGHHSPLKVTVNDGNEEGMFPTSMVRPG